MKISCIAFIFVPILFANLAAAQSPVADVPFRQEYRDPFIALPDGVSDVRAIAVDASGHVWLAAREGAFVRSGSWRTIMPEAGAGPVSDVAASQDGTIWIAAWNGLYHGTADGVQKVEGIDAPIGVVAPTSRGVVAMGPEGLWEQQGDTWRHTRGDWADTPRAIVEAADGMLWVPTAHGLYLIERAGAGARGARHRRELDELLCGDMRDAAKAPDGRIWTGAFLGVETFADGERVATMTTSEGLPHPDVRCLAFDRQGVLWVGTAAGAAKYDGSSWGLRHSLRWLPSDDVRDIAFDSQGSVYVLTPSGISAIKHRAMTLEGKAAYFHDIVMARKIREPFIVEKSRLLTPGDLSTSVTEDDDNDGSYTALYMVMEGFRYQVTKDPRAKENANKAFAAIQFLQEVTGTPAFIARTVAPKAWRNSTANPNRFHDENRAYTPQEIADTKIGDPRYKPVEVRWHESADGQWLWKGDTSSDEIIGHFFGFYYYDLLVAETPKEKAAVRDIAKRICDHIIDGGYMLRDTDGEPTRWAIWAPERLHGDPDWQAERPVNATEMLSILNVTYHLTGDAKYKDHARELIETHEYARYARAPKPRVPSERTHIDTELLTFAFPGLIQPEDDPKLKEAYLEGLEQWHATCAHEHSPFFTFMYGALSGKPFDVDACVEYLRDHPLDLIHWSIDNTRREDVNLVRSPEIDPLQLDRLVPPSERDIMRWDKNPWAAVQGDSGNTESSGVAWLFPYWMGRYYGFIAAP